MPKTTIWTLILSLALTTAAFAATDEEKCQKKKLIALGKRDLCLQKERAKEVLGKTPNLAGCAEKLEKALTKADDAAAKKGASCRWLDNGDGTATDLNSGLQWELKTDDGSIHDKDNSYAWSVGAPKPDGPAFVDFLGTLNGGESARSGVTTTGCFADKCDWRLPTIEELQGILTEPFPCGTSPCTTIPGETNPSFYCSSSTYSNLPNVAMSVFFLDGDVKLFAKTGDCHVRAVRGGS